MVQRIVLLGATVLLLAMAPPVLAAPRMGSVSDPRDTTKDVDGNYNHQDIAAIKVTYDPTGSISYAIRFYAPVPEYAEGNMYVIVSTPTPGYGCDDLKNGAATLSFSPETTPNSDATLTIEGLDGEIQLTREISDDGTEFTVSATHQALAGRPYSCVMDNELGETVESFHCTSFGCSNYYRFTIDGTGQIALRRSCGLVGQREVWLVPPVGCQSGKRALRGYFVHKGHWNCTGSKRTTVLCDRRRAHLSSALADLVAPLP